MSALDQLARLKTEGLSPAFTTDATAEPGTYAAELHRFRVDLDAFRGVGADTKPSVLFEPAVALLGQSLAPTPWLVRGVLPEDSVFVLAGEPKSHKTFGALDLGIAIATGTTAFGEFPSGPARAVAMFLAEDSKRSVRARLSALARGRGLDPAKALERVSVQCRGGLDIGSDQGLCALGAGLRMLPETPALVVLDPFRDLHRGEEDKSGDMSIVMGNLRALRSIVGCSVLLIHHMAKASKDTSGRRVGQRMRGSSAIHGAVDGLLAFAPKDAIGGTTFTNTCEVELKAARGAGRFILTLTLRDDEQGEVEHAAWKYEREEIVTPEDDVANLIFVMHNDWIANGHQPRAMSKREIRSRMQKVMPRVEIAIAAAEARHAIEQVFQGRQSMGYRYVAPKAAA